jgi:hypothetical protein
MPESLKSGRFKLIVSADSFKCLFLHLLILSVIFNTFLNLNTPNKKHVLKNGYVYLFQKFQPNLPIFVQVVYYTIFNLFILTLLHFAFWNYSFQIATSVSGALY